MEHVSSSPARALRVAIVGSGPSGFYAAEALLQSGRAEQVDVLERLPVPYGLVRYGVAPDHPKLKEVVRVYEQIAQDPRFALLGNVALGRDLDLTELGRCYDAVIVATGAAGDRTLGVPGEQLRGVHGATGFVGWYNGHPDCRDLRFDFGHEDAIVMGHGNVALDVCRVLAKPVDELRRTDIARHALEQLAESRIRRIHVVGRRGAAQARFTTRELRELGTLPGCALHVDEADLALDAQSARELADPANAVAAKNFDTLHKFAASTGSAVNAPAAREIRLRFLLSPLALLGSDRLQEAVFARNTLQGPAFAQVACATGETVPLQAGLFITSVGRCGIPLPGLPFDDRAGIIPNVRGRVTGNAAGHPPAYVAGWIKRGATGIIGTNREDSLETVTTLLDDAKAFSTSVRPGREGLRRLLAGRGVETVDFTGWQRIDQAERAAGAPAGKPREKFTRVPEMLAAGKA